MADRARARLLTDLAGQGAREQVIFGTEPLLDMMELSGYALLMSELDPPGIWPRCSRPVGRHPLWDTAPALAAQLSAVLSAHREPLRPHNRKHRAHRTQDGPGQADERTRHRPTHWHAGRGGPRPTPRARSLASSPRASWVPSSRSWPTCSSSSTSSSVLTWLTSTIPRGAERLRDPSDRYRQRTQLKTSGTGSTE